MGFFSPSSCLLTVFLPLGVQQATLRLTIRGFMREFFSKFIPDKSDTMLFSGMGLIFYGLYRINPSSAYIVLGILLIGLAALPYLPRNLEIK